MVMKYSHIKPFVITIARATGVEGDLNMILEKTSTPELDKELQDGWEIVEILPCNFPNLNAVGFVVFLGKN